jgi:hypothetical protein
MIGQIRCLFILSLLLLTNFAASQESGRFYVELSQSELTLGEHFQISFHIENLDGRFEAPDFREFDILSGPNTSVSMSILNGKMSRNSVYTYILRPRQSGDIYIEAAGLYGEDLNLETEVIKITVRTGESDLPKSKKDTKRIEVPVPESDKSQPQDFPSRKNRELKKI